MLDTANPDPSCPWLLLTLQLALDSQPLSGSAVGQDRNFLPPWLSRRPGRRLLLTAVAQPSGRTETPPHRGSSAVGQDGDSLPPWLSRRAAAGASCDVPRAVFSGPPQYLHGMGTTWCLQHGVARARKPGACEVLWSAQLSGLCVSCSAAPPGGLTLCVMCVSLAALLWPGHFQGVGLSSAQGEPLFADGDGP